MNRRVFRWNRMQRRAADLGVDVQTLVRLDAEAQREPPPEADDGERENVRLLDDECDNQGDTPSVA